MLNQIRHEYQPQLAERGLAMLRREFAEEFVSTDGLEWLDHDLLHQDDSMMGPAVYCSKCSACGQGKCTGGCQKCCPGCI